jgi:Rab-GTPase-TBC domain
MNYVVSALFTHSKDEEITFNFFLSLLVNKNLKQLYINAVPEYHVRSYMLDQLIKEHIPDLHLYFKRLGLSAEVISGQWIMTFFCGYFNYPSVLMILDNFFLVNLGKCDDTFLF